MTEFQKVRWVALKEKIMTEDTQRLVEECQDAKTAQHAVQLHNRDLLYIPNKAE